MKLIPLGGKHGAGKFAQVDDADFEWLNQYKWHAKKDKWGNLWVASQIDNQYVRLHRFILDIKNSKIFGDHIDHNGLNNQRNNLRESTPMQNSQNRRSRKNSSSKFLGVNEATYNKNLPGRIPQTRYAAHIRVNKKLIFLGHYPLTPCGELLAAIKYDEAAIKYHGEFANLNFKPLWQHT